MARGEIKNTPFASNDQSKSTLFIIEDNTLRFYETGGSSSSSPQDSIVTTGMVIDQKYRILGLLGEGGMGAVYRAHHQSLNKEVALKTFKSNNFTAEHHLRFQREAKALARLNHSAVVQIFDFGFGQNDQPYYTMEYLIGQSLAEKIKLAGPLSPPEALEIFIQACQGLSLAHSKSIIHRDLKPSNIFLQESGGKIQAKIVDFGIASLTEGSSGQNLTIAGAVFGSPLYMSPEQASGAAVNAVSDIYSLGCTLFEALTGSPPFFAENALQTIIQHQTAKAPSLKERSDGRQFSLALEQTLATMLAKSPDRRQQSMEKLLGDLQYLLALEKKAAPRMTAGKHGQESSSITNSEENSFKQSAQFNDDKSRAKARRTTVWLMTAAATIAIAGTAVFFLTHKAPLTVPRRTDSDNQGLPHNSSQASLHSLPKGSRTVENGKIYFQISWPDREIGHFPYTDISSAFYSVAKWPAGKPLTFEPSREFSENAANFQAIPDSSITGIKLTTQMPHKRLMEILGDLKNRQSKLYYIDLIQNDFFDADLASLSDCHQLFSLYINGAKVQGKTMAAFVHKMHLHAVGFSDGIDTKGLLQNLEGDKEINYLALTIEPIDLNDMQMIATLPNLANLDLSTTGVGDSEIKALKKLKELKVLSLRQCPISPASISTFAEMAKNQLTNLELSGTNWSESERKRLKKFIPSCHFFDEFKNDTNLEEKFGSWH